MHIQPEETVLAFTRKHWFIVVSETVGIVAAGVLPFVAAAFVGHLVPVPPAAAVFFASAWLLGVWVVLFTVWTHYYLDVWVVTDRRIIHMDQIRLFTRTVSTLRIERVQDIQVERHGFFATLLNFGDLKVQAAGPEARYSAIKGIPNPAQVRNTILEYVDITTEHKNRLTFNGEQRPSEGT